MNEKIFILFILLGTIIIIISFFIKKENHKHRYNVEKATQILKKIKNLTPGAKMNYLKKINPYVFEELVLTVYKYNGYKVKRNSRYSGDGGIDGIVYKESKKYLIQAKRYSGYIKRCHIDDFNDVVRSKGANGGIFIHTGRTGGENFKRFERVEIISGDKLIRMIDNIILNNNGN
jgi:restriction system protein